MDLNLYQKTLARIYTDAAFRNKFFEDRVAFVSALGIDEISSQHLRSLNREEVELFSTGLINKRFGNVKSLLLLSFKFSEGTFSQLFYSYAMNYLPEGGHQKYANDAIQFSQYFLKNTDKNSIPWTADLIRFEVMMIRSFNASNRILCSFFNYPVYNLTKDSPPDIKLKKKKSMMILFRFNSKSKLRRFLMG
jgi:hypothetical protein